MTENKTTMANQVHHIKSPFSYKGTDWEKMYDMDNLMAVCAECHGMIHAEQNGHIPPQKMIEALEALFDDED